MDAFTLLETRVASLERALRRSRSVAALLALALVLIAAGAFLPQDRSQVPPEARRRLDASAQSQLATQLQSAPTAQAQELLRTPGLVLTSELGVEIIVLRAGADQSLIVEAPDGREIIRLGGEAARRIGH
jgi:hypothetical protein